MSNAEEMDPEVDTGLPTASGGAGGEPISSASQWTARQIGVEKWLKSNAPTLAPIYSAAVQMVQDPTFPGRVWLVAHAVREIGNRLPDAIAGELRVARTEYSQLAEGVHAAWVDDGLPSDGSVPVLPASDPDSSGPERYDISWSLITSVGELVVGHLAVADRCRRRVKTEHFWPVENCAGSQEPK